MLPRIWNLSYLATLANGSSTALWLAANPQNSTFLVPCRARHSSTTLRTAYSGYSRETQPAAPDNNWAYKNGMLQLQTKILNSLLADRQTKDFALHKVFTNLKQVALAKLQTQQGRKQGSDSSCWKQKRAFYCNMPGHWTHSVSSLRKFLMSQSFRSVTYNKKTQATKTETQQLKQKGFVYKFVLFPWKTWMKLSGTTVP